MRRGRSRENAEAKKLWDLREEDFNKWRQQNDLPRLLAFFQRELPRFSEWQKSFGITDSEFVSLNRTSEYFIGNGARYITDATSPEPSTGKPKRTLFLADKPGDLLLEEIRRTWGQYPMEVHGSKRIEPFFFWFRRANGSSVFPIPQDINRGYARDLQYMSWHHGDLTYSSAFLFHSHQVLKLGAVNITPEQLDGRNLDFVDLDGLVVTGSGATHSTHIAYSSCREISLAGADKPFLTFHRCQLENLYVEKCQLQDLWFLECGLSRPTFKDSRLFRGGFVDSTPGGVDFNNCELQDFHYKPARASEHWARADCHKRLRVAYQQRGNRHDASEYFYRERVSEMLARAFPLLPYYDSALPHRPYIGSYRDLADRCRGGQYTVRRALKFVGGNVLWHLRILLRPHRVVPPLVTKCTRFMVDLIDWAVWGFGERPARLFPWVAGVVLAYSAKYFVGPNPKLRGDAAEALYCSAANFATMGCVERTSSDSVEGILGAVFLALMVAAFSNRTRY